MAESPGRAALDIFRVPAMALKSARRMASVVGSLARGQARALTSCRWPLQFFSNASRQMAGLRGVGTILISD